MPNILITGGAKRIGAELACRFAQEGFSVVVHYNTSADDAEALRDDINQGPGRCEIVGGDLSDKTSVAEIFAQAHEKFGDFDVCINNASLFRNDDVISVSDDLFDAHMAVNLKAPVYFAEQIAAQKTTGPDTLIINMLDNKVFAINPDFFTYTLSKSALHTATKMLAMRFEGAPRVCGIAPSITLISGKQNQENFEKSSRINPLGRRVYPSDIAAAALFMWHTKSFNDQVITIDGGQTMMNLPRDVAYYVKEGLMGE